MIRTLIRQLLREVLLLEDKIQDLIDADPSGNLWSARELGVTNIGGLMWLKSMIDKNIVGDAGEPIADVAPTVVLFFKQGMSDRLGRAGLPTDIMKYKNPGELRQTIETLGASKSSQKKAVKKGETDMVYESDNFLVVMPHTTASSIFYGKGTTWCTTATEGSNLFLSYVGSGRGIILYYILKKGGDSITDPNAKVCLATVKGEPHFSTAYGGLSVDSKNNGLTRDKFNQALGDEAAPILDAIVKHTAQIGSMHPAAKQVDQAVTSLATWKAATAKLKEDEFNDFVSFAFRDRSPSRDILEDALNDPRIKNNSLYYIYGSPNFDTALLIKKLEGINDAWSGDANAVIAGIAHNKSMTLDQMQYAIDTLSTKKNGKSSVSRLLQNPVIPGDMLEQMYDKETSGMSISYIAQNPNLPDELVMRELAKATGATNVRDYIKPQQFIIDVLRGWKIHPQYQKIVWDAVTKGPKKSYTTEFMYKVASTLAMGSEDPQMLLDVARVLMSSNSSYYETARLGLRNLVTNTVTPDSVIRELAEDDNPNTLIMMFAKARLENPDYNEEDVEEAHKREYPEEYEDSRDYDDDDDY